MKNEGSLIYFSWCCCHGCVANPNSLFLMSLSEGDSIGSASCESYASGQSQAYSLQGESYTHTQTALQPTSSASVRTPCCTHTPVWLVNHSLKSSHSNHIVPWITFQGPCASAHPPIVPVDESGSAPNVPIGQSISMSSMSTGQSGGGLAGQTFLQPSTMVPQVKTFTPSTISSESLILISI